MAMKSHRRTFTPRLESLDNRALPSTVQPFVEADGTVTIRGDQRADTIVVTDDGTGLAGAIKVNIDGELFESAGVVTKIEIWSRAGADDVTYTLNGDLTTARAVEVNLGNFHDSFTAVLNGSVGAGGSLTINANGGNGHDHLTLDADGFDVDADGDLIVGFKGGNGHDTLDLKFAGLLDGTAAFTADGGNGKDDVTGNFVLGSSAPAEEGGEPTPSAGTLTVDFRGGNGVDRMKLTVPEAGGAATITAALNGGHGKDDLTAVGDVTIVDPPKKK